MKLVVKPLERYGSLKWITSTILLNKYSNFVSEDHFSEMQNMKYFLWMWIQGALGNVAILKSSEVSKQFFDYQCRKRNITYKTFCLKCAEAARVDSNSTIFAYL